MPSVARFSVTALCQATFISLFVLPTPAMAAQDAIICPADRINSPGNICTASDVQLAAAALGAVDEGLTCFPGDTYEVALAGTVNLRKGDRFDIGVWISTDGKDIRLRGGNNGAPDEGGAQLCEVLPLPFQAIAELNNPGIPIIDSFDDPATPQDCYDTSAANNGDVSEGFQLSSERDSIVNGRVDVDGDGVITASDDSGPGPVPPARIFGAQVRNSGCLDLDLDGIGCEVDGSDDGIWNGYSVDDGEIDVDGDGIHGEVDGTDDSAQAYNDFVTLTCEPGPNGKQLLYSLVTWNVPSDAGNVCNVLDPSSYSADFNSSKCSASSSEIPIDVVGVVRIVKSAPDSSAGETFGFTYTNSAPPLADTDPNIDDISAANPFSLTDTGFAEIYADIGQRESTDGPFIPATVVITEDDLPSGWELSGITCELDPDRDGTGGGGVPVNTSVDLVNHSVSVELSYNEADPAASQDGVVCTFLNEPEPATITVVKNVAGADATFNFDFAKGSNPATPFTIQTTSGTGSLGDGTNGPVIVIETGLGDSDFVVIEDLSATSNYEFVNAQCLDENGQVRGTFNSAGGVLFGIEDITLNAGDDLTCTFNNQQQGTVTLTKATVGGDGTFAFTSSPGFGAQGANFNIVTAGGTGSVAQSGLSAGVYTIEEVDPTVNPGGWDFTSLTCNDPDGGSVITDRQVQLDVDAGETISCTWTNTQRGSIVVVKQTLPDGSTETFDFSGDAAGTIGDGQNITVGNLVPGPYVSQETVPAGWDLTGIECDDAASTTPSVGDTDSGIATFNVDAGETVTCTFSNTRLGSITVVKELSAEGTALPTFDFLGQGPSGLGPGSGFTLTPIGAGAAGSDSVTYDNLEPGAYSVVELDPTSDGYQLTSSSCDNMDTPGAITLTPGANVVCTFINSPLGSTTINKVSQGSDGLFSFEWGNLTNPNVPIDESAGFDITTMTGAGSADFTDKLLILEPYDLVEVGLPAVVAPYDQAWNLTNVECMDPTPDATTPDTQVPGANGSDATIVSDSGETVSCTFTNALEGTLVVRKETMPDGVDQAFTFTGDVAGNIRDFSAYADEIFTNGIGLLGSTETVPTGWYISDISCTGASNSTVEIGRGGIFTTPTFEPGDDEIRVDLAAGETVICTFENEAQGSITISKTVQGNDQAFSFTTNYNAGFLLSNGQSDTAGPLSSGTYTITESIVPGYQLTVINCSGETNSTITPSANGVEIVLVDGEAIRCEFVNTGGGSITIEKLTDPAGSSQVFSFSGDVSGSLTHAQTATTMNLLPGTYTSTEAPVDGWDLTGITCADPTNDSFGDTGTGVATFELAAGEDITCTFTNTIQRGIIVVNKSTVPGDTGQSFDFNVTNGADVNSDFPLLDGDSNTLTDLPPSSETGTYVVSEAPVGGWSNTSAACVSSIDGDNTNPAVINLRPGETVTCDFENTQAGSIDLAKAFTGGPMLEADGTYTVTYTVTATNTGGSGSYDIVDTTIPGTGITLNTMSISYLGGTDSGTDGTIGTAPGLVTDESIDELANESWLVTANFTVDPILLDATRACMQGTPVPGTGFYNEVSGSATDPNLDNNADCTGLENPAINLAKAVVGDPVLKADLSYTVNYAITATNTGGVGIYDLVDTFSPAPGVTLNSAVATYVPGTEDSQSGATGDYPNFVTNEVLGAGLEESWLVEANFMVDTAAVDPVEAICLPSNPVPNTGFYNFVEGSETDTDLSDNRTCAPFFVEEPTAVPVDHPLALLLLILSLMTMAWHFQRPR